MASFPHTFTSWASSGGVIVSPLQGVLEVGSKAEFKLLFPMKDGEQGTGVMPGVTRLGLQVFGRWTYLTWSWADDGKVRGCT